MARQIRKDVIKSPNLSINPLFVLLLFIVGLISLAFLVSPYYKYALLPVLVCVGLFLLAMKPQLSYLLIIFLVPFDAYIALNDAYPFLTLTKFIGLWLVIVLFFSFLMKQKGLGLFIFKAPLWKWLWIFLVINLVSALLSKYYLSSFYGVKRLVSAYIVFGLALAVISYKDMVRRIPLVVVISNAIGAILAVFGYLFHLRYFAIGTGVSENAIERATGLSVDPNFLAMTMLFSFPFIVFYLLTSKGVIKKVLNIGLLVINVLTIILTYSRGGALVLLFMILMLCIINRQYIRPRNLGFFLITVMLFFLAVTLFLPTSYKKRLGSVTEKKYDPSIAGRLSYLKVARQTIMEHPLLGTGPLTFPNIYADSKTPYKYLYGDYRRSAHDVYIEILVGTGFMGLAVFLVIIVISLRNLLRVRSHFKAKGDDVLVSLFDAYLLSFTSILVYFYMLSRMFNKYFWMMLAVAQLAVFLVDNLEMIKEKEEEPILFVSSSV